MGRLFWKFFLFIFLAQVTAVLGVTAYFWWEQRQFEERLEESGWRRPEGRGPGSPWAERRGAGAPRPEGADGVPRPFHPEGMSVPHGPPGLRGLAPLPPGPPSGVGPPFGRMRPAGPRLFSVPLVPVLAGLLASLGFAWLLARHFSRPIRALSAAFEAAAEGDLTVRVGPEVRGRADELAELARDYDRMTVRLQALIDGQRRLLHDVSHEMRSPLARLQAAIGIARQQPAKVEVSMDRIELESQRIDRLVGELLTLARLDTGTAARRTDSVDLGELLGAIVDDARFEAGAGAVTIELEAGAGLVLRGDAELLHRAFENVVRNALKYAAGHVIVRAWRAGVRFEVTVEDDGPGVAARDLERIFEPFYRADAGRERAGHGLGLAITARVVRAHGGSVRADNGATGLRVALSLPVPPA